MLPIPQPRRPRRAVVHPFSDSLAVASGFLGLRPNRPDFGKLFFACSQDGNRDSWSAPVTQLYLRTHETSYRPRIAEKTPRSSGFLAELSAGPSPSDL